MSILDQLSSQVGDRTEAANHRVSALCLASPELLDEINAGLKSKDAALVGDCGEVMTTVAQSRPELVAPYARSLVPLLSQKNTRARWEAMHALALVASLKPRLIAGLLPRLRVLVQSDPSVIVRDHAVDALGNYGGTGAKAAQAARPILIEALTTWDGKQAGHALHGLANAASVDPVTAAELHEIGIRYENHPRGVVRNAARALLRATEARTPRG